MKNFNIDRFNLEKMRLGEQPLVLKRISYNEPIITNGRLIDENGTAIGTKGDMYTKYIMDYILENGTLDHNPRPHYVDFYENATYNSLTKEITTADGIKIPVYENDKVIKKDNGIELQVPAHTLSVNNNIECNYDLSKGESPLITLRPIATKASIAEILWIYQMQSNDLVEFDTLLGKNTWEENHKINNWWEDWAIRNQDGSYNLNGMGHPHIGSCYGETARRYNILKHEVIDAIRSNPDGRRNISSLWQYSDFSEPHGLKPCAFLTVWNVRHGWDGKDYLDMILVQRSSDFATAGCINQVQYVALQKMVAKDLGLTPGTFTWKPVNIQIYDRHIDQAIELLGREPINCSATIEVSDSVKNFSDFKVDDVFINDYPKELIKAKNPQLKFPLGI